MDEPALDVPRPLEAGVYGDLLDAWFGRLRSRWTSVRFPRMRVGLRRRAFANRSPPGSKVFLVRVRPEPPEGWRPDGLPRPPART
jgi:hypothetical protein